MIVTRRGFLKSLLAPVVGIAVAKVALWIPAEQPAEALAALEPLRAAMVDVAAESSEATVYGWFIQSRRVDAEPLRRMTMEVLMRDAGYFPARAPILLLDSDSAPYPYRGTEFTRFAFHGQGLPVEDGAQSRVLMAWDNARSLYGPQKELWL